MRAYPVLYHATVFNEIRVLQREGYSFEVFSLLEVNESELRRDSISDLPKAIYCWRDRLPGATVLRANLEIVARIGPAQYWQAFQFARQAALLTNLRAFMRFAAWAWELRRRGVTHLHAHWATEAGTVALIFHWLNGLPFSFTAHAYDIYLQPQFLERKLQQAAFAVTVSAYNRQWMLDHFGSPGVAEKLHVIYPLIDLDQFPPRHAPPQNGTPGSGALTIVSIGRLTEYKGLIYLVEACRLLKERGVAFVCQIVGEGEDREPLEAAIKRYDLQDSVKLLGSLPYKEVPPLLEQATLFALPCIIADNGDRDGMPLVLIEAMAREVPVVSSDVIGLKELVRPEVGLLAPPRDPAALAEAMVALYRAGPQQQQAMGRAGRAIVENELAKEVGAARLAELIAKYSR
jgi:glycosyltransferase involved in cell wall biosynthesis